MGERNLKEKGGRREEEMDSIKRNHKKVHHWADCKKRRYCRLT